MDKVLPDDIRGKSVLDLGCNIGMNCYLAIERGALRATGVDLPELAAAATRMNSFFGAPCRFVARDLNGAVEDLEPHDTVLVFALIGHLRSVTPVIRLIESVNATTVYVESHCDIQSQGDLDAFLKASIFESVEFLGFDQDNLARRERTRRLYRCKTRNARP